jgi:Lamin Tail Domain
MRANSLICRGGLVLMLASCATTAGGHVPGVPDDDADVGVRLGDAGGDAQLAEDPDASVDAAAPAALVALAPSPIFVARGGVASVTATINRPAIAGGEVIRIAATSGTAATLPATVTIAEGATSASFDVHGLMTGGPFELTATLGAAQVSVPLRVVPAVTAITPGASDVTVGESAYYTVALESPAPIALELALVSSAPAVASVPAKVTIPAGQSSVGFEVTGVGLGGPVGISASLAGSTASAKARALGVYLSEVLYDLPSSDTSLEWVELYNASTVAVDITGLRLDSAGGANGTGYSTSLVLAGTLAPGQCAVVGGPANAGLTFFQAMDLNPDLGNASSGKADGIRLATAAGGIVDAVLYGGANSDAITDENGAASPPDVPGALAGQSIERTAPGLLGPWQVQTMPSPGDCSPIAQ